MDAADPMTTIADAMSTRSPSRPSAAGGVPPAHVMHPNHFAYRHIGPRQEDIDEMVASLGYPTLDAFIDRVVPEDIRLRRPLELPPGRSEREVLQALRGLARQNQVFRSYLGMG